MWLCAPVHVVGELLIDDHGLSGAVLEDSADEAGEVRVVHQILDQLVQSFLAGLAVGVDATAILPSIPPTTI